MDSNRLITPQEVQRTGERDEHGCVYLIGVKNWMADGTLNDMKRRKDLLIRSRWVVLGIGASVHFNSMSADVNKRV